jgi:radical SAM protein with 4Fe4S-binding SPASM domain
MEWDLYKRIVDEIATFGYRINLGLNFGGESLLHNRFADMLNYAASKGVFRIGFNTNGVLLRKDIAMSVVKNVDKVVISLDGVGKKHESLRIGSNYEAVEKNILDLIKTRSGAIKPQIMVNMTLSEHSPRDVSEFVDQWVHIADCVQVFPCYSEDLQIVNDREFFDQKTLKRSYCSWPFSYMAILWNGDVTTCCHDIGGVNTRGNLANQSISDIWKSDSFVSLRHEAVTNGFDSKSLCHKCRIWQTEFYPFAEKKDGKLIQYFGQCKSYQLLGK